MSATDAQITQLRRMTGLTGSTAYTDSELVAYIERYPLLDDLGNEPYSWDTSTDPPFKDDNEDWIPTYDLNAAAADVWQERAAGLAGDFDFSVDGGSYQRSQVYAQYNAQARYYAARRSMRNVRSIKWPPENTNAAAPEWIGNAPEVD